MVIKWCLVGIGEVVVVGGKVVRGKVVVFSGRVVVVFGGRVVVVFGGRVVVVFGGRAAVVLVLCTVLVFRGTAEDACGVATKINTNV
jgi:hypothetical protein